MQQVSKCARVFMFVAFGMAAAALPAAAQDKAEVSGGWQYLHSSSTNLPAGWYADVAGNVNKVVGIVGEIAGNDRSASETDVVSGVPVNVTAKISMQTYMGGVRVSARQSPVVVPFAQVLAGGAHTSATVSGSAQSITVSTSNSQNDFAMDFGGGVNVKAAPHVGVRAQASYLRLFTNGGSNDFRARVGVVIPF